MEGSALTISAYPGEGIEILALEKVAVGHEEDLWLDLSETVQDPLDPEIRGT